MKRKTIKLAIQYSAAFPATSRSPGPQVGSKGLGRQAGGGGLPPLPSHPSPTSLMGSGAPFESQQLHLNRGLENERTYIRFAIHETPDVTYLTTRREAMVSRRQVNGIVILLDDVINIFFVR